MLDHNLNGQVFIQKLLVRARPGTTKGWRGIGQLVILIPRSEGQKDDVEVERTVFEASCSEVALVIH